MQLLVAETTESGDIAAVWQVKDGMRTPRPVTDREVLWRDIATAEISGTTRDRMMQWHHRRTSRQG